MFSKYSSIEVPQNYSGSRFRKSTELKTETKTHPATDYSATKSSVSPTFKESTEPYIDTHNGSCELPSPSEECMDSNCPKGDCANEGENDCYCEDECNSCKICDESKQHGSLLSDLLGNIKTEDLLLICLIIFLSADGGISNNDIIVLLSLILAYHA